jgi:hypothetical protein
MFLAFMWFPDRTHRIPFYGSVIPGPPTPVPDKLLAKLFAGREEHQWPPKVRASHVLYQYEGVCTALGNFNLVTRAFGRYLRLGGEASQRAIC